jgi:predicted small integral membrane protein
MSTTSVTRWSQIAISALLGCYTALICFTNITDYNTNFLFIQNVAGMTDIFSTGNGWRSIQNPMLLHLTYWLI